MSHVNLPPEPEDIFQGKVIELAQMHRWTVLHIMPAKLGDRWVTAVSADGKGYPDLTLVRERIVWMELKADGKYLEPDQKIWRDAILAAGGEHHVLRPKDWDKLVEILS